MISSRRLAANRSQASPGAQALTRSQRRRRHRTHYGPECRRSTVITVPAANATRIGHGACPATGTGWPVLLLAMTESAAGLKYGPTRRQHRLVALAKRAGARSIQGRLNRPPRRPPSDGVFHFCRAGCRAWRYQSTEGDGEQTNNRKITNSSAYVAEREGFEPSIRL